MPELSILFDFTRYTKFAETLFAFLVQWPGDPYGELVPLWNVELYRLARAAYRGDYLARARFLNEIGADESADNMLFIQDLYAVYPRSARAYL
jgi:hypothetical protein